MSSFSSEEDWVKARDEYPCSEPNPEEHFTRKAKEVGISPWFKPASYGLHMEFELQFERIRCQERFAYKTLKLEEIFQNLVDEVVRLFPTMSQDLELVATYRNEVGSWRKKKIYRIINRVTNGYISGLPELAATTLYALNLDINQSFGNPEITWELEHISLRLMEVRHSKFFYETEPWVRGE